MTKHETTTARLSTDVVPADGTDLTYEDLMASLPIETDPNEVTRRILNQLGQAKTLDEAFAVWETTSSKNLAGRAFEVLSVRWSWYMTTSNEVPLAEVSAIEIGTGEPVTWVTTAKNICGFLWWLQLNKALPAKFRILEKATRSGNTVLVPARI